MAKPRIFVSSTYFDLKHIRSSLDIFIDSLGYESILSEKGDIAYSPDIPLDESCFREVENVDVFVLIIGPRYGSEISSGEKKASRSFFERYESITKKEYETALRNDVPIYILIESNVYSEYQTYLRNKGVKTINYAHVESINIFTFIEDILAKPRNNPIFTFEKFGQIEDWLKSQWAGLFRELLRKRSNQTQLRTLTAEVNGLQEVNKTLKTYLEALMTGANKAQTNKLIEVEERRLKDIDIKRKIAKNRFYKFMEGIGETIDVDDFIKVLLKFDSLDQFINEIPAILKNRSEAAVIQDTLRHNSDALEDLNEIRKILDLSLFKSKDDS
jgi:hypothetical protein